MRVTDPLAGALIDGRYELLSPIGSGGMGVVYRAWQVGVERAVAVKLHRPPWSGDPELVVSLSSRFRREAAALGRLRHPGIVTVFDAGVASEGLFLVMELVEGPTLAARLETDGPLTSAQTTDLGIQLAEALHHAHQQDILHRDLKPANVAFSGERALLLDFGIALLSDQTRLTAPLQAIGTPAYMAPERVLDPDAIDHRIDLFSLGVLLYEALTDRLPFDGPDAAAVQARVLHGVPDPLPPNTPEPLRGTILALLSTEPDRRPPDAGAVAARLRGAPVPTPRRWPQLLAAFALLLALPLALQPFTTTPAEPPVIAAPPAEVDAPEVVAIPEVVLTEPPLAEPAPPALAVVVAPPAPSATLQLEGDLPAQLRQGRRVIATGQAVTPGRYAIWSDFGGGWVEVSAVELIASGDVWVRCNRIRLTCTAEER